MGVETRFTRIITPLHGYCYSRKARSLSLGPPLVVAPSPILSVLHPWRLHSLPCHLSDDLCVCLLMARCLGLLLQGYLPPTPPPAYLLYILFFFRVTSPPTCTDEMGSVD